MAPLWRATSQPTAKHDHGRNAANVEARGNRGLILGIQFREAQSGLEAPRGGFEGRCHGAAGRAPRRPEVDHHGQIAAADMFGEIRPLSGSRASLQKSEMAAGAARCFADPLGRQTHHRVTVRAYHMNSVAGRAGAHRSVHFSSCSVHFGSATKMTKVSGTIFGRGRGLSGVAGGVSPQCAAARKLRCVAGSKAMVRALFCDLYRGNDFVIVGRFLMYDGKSAVGAIGTEHESRSRS